MGEASLSIRSPQTDFSMTENKTQVGLKRPVVSAAQSVTFRMAPRLILFSQATPLVSAPPPRSGAPGLGATAGLDHPACPKPLATEPALGWSRDPGCCWAGSWPQDFLNHWRERSSLSLEGAASAVSLGMWAASGCHMESTRLPLKPTS